jgi:hypothetical protein
VGADGVAVEVAVDLTVGLPVAGFGQEPDHVVEQIAGSPPVEGADRPRLPESQCHGIPGVGLPLGGVDLVDHHPHRPPGPLEHPGDGEVLVDQPDRDVHHEEHDVRFGDGPFGLGADLGVEWVVARQPAAGVDHGEGMPAPLGVELLAIAGHAGPLLYDRGTAADDAVDQG